MVNQDSILGFILGLIQGFLMLPAATYAFYAAYKLTKNKPILGIVFPCGLAVVVLSAIILTNLLMSPFVDVWKQYVNGSGIGIAAGAIVFRLIEYIVRKK